MTFATSVSGPAQALATVSGGRAVASYPTYGQAQRLVDHLSDSGFPVEHAAIVGRDLRLVEQVVGRLTKTRAALIGAGSGAWFGLFIGTLLTLVVIAPDALTVTLGAVGVGALSGGVFGFVAHWATHGQRDFRSATAVVAGQYDVIVSDAHVDRATQLLTSLG